MVDAFTGRLNDVFVQSAFSHRELAALLGYSSASTIRKMTEGMIRLPLEKVAPLERSLALEPGTLMGPWLRTYFSTELFEDLRRVFSSMKNADEPSQQDALALSIITDAATGSAQ